MPLPESAEGEREAAHVTAGRQGLSVQREGVRLLEQVGHVSVRVGVVGVVERRGLLLLVDSVFPLHCAHPTFRDLTAACRVFLTWFEGTRAISGYENFNVIDPFSNFS